MSKMKLIDVLADYEVNELQCDIIQGNLIKWIQDEVVNRLADIAIEQYQKWLRDNPDKRLKVEQTEIKQKVLDKLAEKIIDEYFKNDTIGN